MANLVAIASSFDHDGTRPQRRRWITRSPFDRWRTTGTLSIGDIPIGTAEKRPLHAQEWWAVPIEKPGAA